jgi:alpha-glucosidase
MNYGRHNGLPSCLTAMLTSGLVGFSNTHCDMGGYVYVGGLADRDRGLMQRWMGFAAFSPVFRTH